ncbi:MAG: D-alanyl-D-alanine carboxypeptidase [Alphaproteobacteria bacterium]|nr:D-alanyl-D-alanine carboxypeptidase [Alphaproteobacteria bacterium]
MADDPLNTDATFAYIMDGDTGLPLYSKRGDEAMVPASMSKLMLFYVVFERLREGRLKLDDQFTVSEHAWRTGGAAAGGTAASSAVSTMFLKVHSQVSVDDLLHGAIIVSGNDACIVLAEGIAGSEEAMAREMTAKAHELGLTHSTFANVTGLEDPGQRMSAADIAKLAYLIIHDFPERYKLFSQTSFTWNGITQPNRNPLLTELPGADGVKTGHLSVSGFGLVGSAVRDGHRRIIVLNGLKSDRDRRTEGPRVMRAAFTDFNVVDLVEKGAQVATADVWLGQQKQVPLVAIEASKIGLHVSAVKGIRSVVVYDSPLSAPIKQGDIVGNLVISAPGVPDITVPVAAGASVKKLGLFGRALVGLKGE